MSSRTSWRAACAATLLSLAGACKVAPPASPPPHLSASAVVLETPIDVQDELYACGLSSITALCGYYGVEVPPARRAELLRTASEEHGLSGAQLRDALQGLGFEVFVFRGTLDGVDTGLRHHVDARRPLIVMTSERDANHYSLLIGYDPAWSNVVLLDPGRGRVVLPAASFERQWKRAQCFTLLAVPAAAAHAAPSHAPDPGSTSP